MNFKVIILGSNSALPVNGRHPTAQILVLKEHHILIDCGEGTQVQMEKYDIKAGKIDYIFISHLHGDHYFGLIGLITSYNLNQRQKKLSIFGPPELEELINFQLKISKVALKYELLFTSIFPENGKLIFQHSDFMVHTLAMNHRLPCCGFLFSEVRSDRKILKSALEKYQVPIEKIVDLKKGKDLLLPDGTLISNEALTLAPPKARKYAFCSDTTYQESIVPFIKHVDLLYHETTFSADLAQRALETFHSTTHQAGKIAQLAEVKKLIIGHFSARYHVLNQLLEETQTVFNNSELAIEGKTFLIEQE